MATHLGMDPRRDRELLWIARQALHAPRPSGWSEVRSEAGNVYYVEDATGKTSWWLPTDEEFRRLYLKRAQHAEPLGAPRPASGAAPDSLPPVEPSRSASARGARDFDRERERDETFPRGRSAHSARVPSSRAPGGRSSADGASHGSRSARPVVAPGGELRPSGAVLLPVSPRQRLRAEFWASVGAADRGKAGLGGGGMAGPVAQWQASLVARVKNRLAVREQDANPVAGHTARARARREEARVRSREVGREIAPPKRERVLSSGSLQALEAQAETQTHKAEETAVQIRQVVVAPHYASSPPFPPLPQATRQPSPGFAVPTHAPRTNLPIHTHHPSPHTRTAAQLATRSSIHLPTRPIHPQPPPTPYPSTNRPTAASIQPTQPPNPSANKPTALPRPLLPPFRSRPIVGATRPPSWSSRRRT